MFPISDSTPRRTFPFVNYLIIAINIYIFYLELTSPNIDDFIYQYAFFPSHFNFLDPYSYIPIFTSIFVHGGILHILSNMWFLHIFGDNVEDRFGHFHYFIFYMLAGLVATLTQYYMSFNPDIPLIGASGAISGVAGAYFVLFRRSTVYTIIPVIFSIIEIPVWFFLGYWFVIQVLSGVGTLGSVDPNSGGVAFFAHIGGFAFGYFYALLFAPKSEFE